jgi:NAD(P)-dependent dehydrogenase (short-subunit alcohol dehydrogenase family)
MSTATGSSLQQREPQLLGQTVVVIGGSAGIGLETARLARDEGAKLVLAARNPEPLQRAASELGAQQSAAFDATDFAQLERFFNNLPAPIDHVLVTGPGPYYATLAEFDFDKARRDVEAHLFLPMQVARMAKKKVRAGGTLLFMGGVGGRHTAPGLALIGALTAALPALVRNLALEIAPVRVNLIAAGFVDTPLSATLLGNQLDARREQLRTTLPIGRVVGPADVAALAVHIMDQHRRHRRHLRYRWRPAARRAINLALGAVIPAQAGVTNSRQSPSGLQRMQEHRRLLARGLTAAGSLPNDPTPHAPSRVGEAKPP